MIAPTRHSIGFATVVAAFALIVSGCYSTANHRYNDSYSYYRHSHYLPYTDLRIGIFSGTRKHHYGNDRHHWRGTPYRHHGKSYHHYGDPHHIVPHSRAAKPHYRSRGHDRHRSGRHHNHRHDRRH